MQLNSNYLSQILVLKYQDSEHIRKHLKKSRNYCDLEQDTKKCQLESQCFYLKRHFGKKLLMESDYEGL